MRAAPIIWFAVKWLVIPVGLGAVGYYVVGPRLGDIPAVTGVTKPKPTVANTTPSTDEPTLALPKRTGDPQVTVDVGPATTITDRGMRHSKDTRYGQKRRSHSRRRSSSTSTSTAPAAPPSDTGGSSGGGGGDTGGSTGGAGDPGV